MLDKYKLDTTEGPSRVRRKLIPNASFYQMYPYRPYLDDPSLPNAVGTQGKGTGDLQKALKGKVAVSRDSKLFYEAQKSRRPRALDSRILDTTAATVSSPSDERPPFHFTLNTDIEGLTGEGGRRLRGELVAHSTSVAKTRGD